MNIDELRKKYLKFFEKRGHHIIPSASLIPENDPTTLFTGSGMQAIIPYLLGESHPQGNRIADSQKCFRAGDIDEVGDNRHTTFFEMLGNWSLGDYFKKEQIPWIFEFITKEVGLDPNHIYITVFCGNKEINIPRDDESVKLWQKEFDKVGIKAKAVDNSTVNGMQDGRIFYYDETKNWWSRIGPPQDMNEGEPGGPDTEIFWDLGGELGLHEKSSYKDRVCHVNCECGRFLEIGNSVFMEYIKKEEGFKPLPNKNVDFGGGLERMAAAVSNTPDIFLIDVFKPSLKTLERLSKKSYEGGGSIEDKSFRVILDHLRSAIFLIGDGAPPSNKDQCYITRRLIRRAVCYAHKLGIKDIFCHKIAEEFIKSYKSAYPLLKEKKNLIINELVKEEEKFLKTLNLGHKYFEKIAVKDGIISGLDAFILYSTYGFPVEMTQELAGERNVTVNMEDFEKEMKKHQKLSRKGAEQKFKGGLADQSEETTKLHTTTHLMQSALRKILGEHVLQRGSNITGERLRFDFSHPEKVTKEQLEKVQNLVNETIDKKFDVIKELVTVEDAKKRGAIGIFDDKYTQIGERVCLYSVVDGATGEVVSCEICGGPHVKNTGDLGNFEIKKEESVSAGVRRIKAVLSSK